MPTQKGQLSPAVPERAHAGTTARLPGTSPLCRMAYPENGPTHMVMAWGLPPIFPLG